MSSSFQTFESEQFAAAFTVAAAHVAEVGYFFAYALGNTSRDSFVRPEGLVQFRTELTLCNLFSDAPYLGAIIELHSHLLPESTYAQLTISYATNWLY